MTLRVLISVVVLNTFLCDCYVSSCDPSCTDLPVFTPSSLVVKHGDPASASCSVCHTDCDNSTFGLEAAEGETKTNGTMISWEIDRLTEWGMNLMCYYTDDVTGVQCCTTLPLTLYKPPDSVSISVQNHTGPMSEGHQYTLLCTVHGVAPVENLAVTFYRGNTQLGRTQSSSNTEIKPVNETYTLTITPSKEDDGAQYWCGAELELGPEGPQPPPVVKSENITTTVYYKPHHEGPSHPPPINITEGERLRLNCSAVGNPSPSYTWTLPNGSFRTTSVLTIDRVTFADDGPYSCSVSNGVGAVNVTFSVKVQEPPDSVSISFQNHTGPMLEGHQYTLLCTVHGVAPAENLTVTFYRGSKQLGQTQSSSTTPTEPMTNEIYALHITPGREDNETQYWCEAQQKLAGLRRMKSQRITAAFHYKPQLQAPLGPNNITVTLGHILHLKCSAVGNPPPSYAWTLPSSNHHQPENSSILTIEPVGYEHEGKFTCSARNTIGNVNMSFNVKVRAKDILYIVATVLASSVLVLACLSVGCIYYYRYNRMGQYNLGDVLRPQEQLIPMSSS